MIWWNKKGIFLGFTKDTKSLGLLSKKTSGKNRVQQDLSTCITQKFNGYQICSQKLKCKQKCLLEPVDIIFEPVRENKDIICHFASDLFLAYRTDFSQKVGWKDVISNLSGIQCYYWNHMLLEKVSWKKHVKCCSSIARISYKFNNRKIVSFQDNFKYMGNLPFTVYFNFETTTGYSVTDDKKNLRFQLLSNRRLPVLTWSWEDSGF